MIIVNINGDRECTPGWQSKKYCSRLSAKNHNQRNIVDSWRNICPCWRQNIVAILFCQRHINWDIRSVVENDRWWFGGFTKICSSTETQKNPPTSNLQNSNRTLLQEIEQISSIAVLLFLIIQKHQISWSEKPGDCKLSFSSLCNERPYPKCRAKSFHS